MLTRRMFLACSGAVALAGCETATRGSGPSAALGFQADPSSVAYGALPNEAFAIPPIDTTKIDPKYLRQEVAYATDEPVGTIIVDTSGPFLYLVGENGRALRYGIGVGRQGFSWAGRAVIQLKRQWPRWTPPAEMIDRQPELEPFRNGGMDPGLGNPLGARALYLFQNGRDTLYRLHGTNEPWSIGKSVSSGCIRLFNQDIIDLYNRVPVGTEVMVLGGEQAHTA